MHLPTVSDCKHVFAAGHYNYLLKSSNLYVQETSQLLFNYPCVLRKFLRVSCYHRRGASRGGHVRSMSHSHTPNPRYESGATRVARDSEMVVKVTAAMEMNPFTAETTHVINM